MNSVTLIGRLTKDPELKQGNMAVCKFNIAINRGKNSKGEDMGTDFPRITVFGKQAENCQKYLAKGRLVAIQGRVTTGSYEKDGKTIYTTDVVADKVEFLERGDKPKADKPLEAEEPSGFAELNEEVPW